MHNASPRPSVPLTRKAFIVGVAALATLVLALGARPLRSQAPVTVFAAASLQNVLDDAARTYSARTGRKVRISFGASSALARQIEQGAPADIFFSADEDWMDYLAQRRLIVEASRSDLLANRLALIAPADSRVLLTVGRDMPIAGALGNGRLAMAAPEVPAGRYARAALADLGVLPSVERRIVSAGNVRAAMQFVARGETPLGIVYVTDARVEPRVRIVGLFPESAHPKILYPAALAGASRNPDADRFLDWLKGPQARVVFVKHGFGDPR